MKKSIMRKIVVSYLILVFITLSFVGVFFNLVIRNYTERTAKQNLLKEARTVYTFIRIDFNSKDITDLNKKIKLKSDLISLNKQAFLDSKIAIISRDTQKNVKLLFPSGEEAQWFNKNIVSNLESHLLDEVGNVFEVMVNGQKYIGAVYRAPVRFETTEKNKFWVVLYTPVKEIYGLNKGIRRMLFIILLITGIFAIAYGYLSANSIPKPIVMLIKRAQMLSKRDFDTKIKIKTGDEIEDLANTIDKMAVELKQYDIAQKKFIQNASHELKTPLMSIQGYAEGIKDGVFEDNNEALDIIVGETSRLKKIVEELILLSKLETMDDYYNFNLQSMNEIIKKSVDKINSLVIKNNKKINIMLYNDAKITVDRDKIIQALINIIGNSIRYAKNEINITTSNDRKVFEIAISDDGMGFENNEAEKIFERFYKGKNGNTGLGLAITKVIVEKHRGTITARNNEKGGAEFIIRLNIL